MKRTICWILTVLMLASLAFLISSPAVAEVTPLPLDQTVPGNPLSPDGWLSADEYQDESIHITVEYPIAKVGKAEVRTVVVRIQIADPTQIRTAMSYDNYDKQGYVKAETMAVAKNAVVAVDGDFFKYHYKKGYVVRQGVFYRDKLNGERDVLVIDDQGDFWSVRDATSESMAVFLNDVFPAERSVINTFTLGPVLVEDGQPQEIHTEEFEYRYLSQRIAVVQLGHLEYAVVEIDGKYDGSAGMNLETFAAYLAELFPDCRLAYNLDGGGSTALVVNGARVHKTPGYRDISDILYFASACTEDTK